MSHQNCQNWMVFSRTTSLSQGFGHELASIPTALYRCIRPDFWLSQGFGHEWAFTTTAPCLSHGFWHELAFTHTSSYACPRALGTSWLLHIQLIRPLPGLWVRVGFYAYGSLGLSQDFGHESVSMSTAPLASSRTLGTSWLLHIQLLRPLPGLWVRVGFYAYGSLGLSQDFGHESVSMSTAPLASSRTLGSSWLLCLQFPWPRPGLWSRVGFYAYSSFGLSQDFRLELAYMPTAPLASPRALVTSWL